jgi:hypothetical protein
MVFNKTCAVKEKEIRLKLPELPEAGQAAPSLPASDHCLAGKFEALMREPTVNHKPDHFGTQQSHKMSFAQ